MPRVSQIPVGKDVYKDITDSFVSAVSDLVKTEEVGRFLSDFLTPEERLMLSKRLVLALLIRQGYSTSDIKDVLKVSRTTINQMRHWLLHKKGIEIGVEKLIARRRKKDSGDKIEDTLKHIPPLTRSKKDIARWLNR